MLNFEFLHNFSICDISSFVFFVLFLFSASDGLEKTLSSLKGTWTPLPLVEAGSVFSPTLSLVYN